MKAHPRLVSLLAVGVLSLGVFALGVVGIGRVDAQPKPQTGQTSEKVELLFVQNGTSGTYDGKRLTLEGVGPTIFFSDRPYRVTGQVTTSEFISHWDKGSDNFAGNPPNATLSIFGDKGVNSAVVELTEPKLRKNTLSYRVKVLKGSLPSAFRESSLFIDILGRWRMFAAGAMVGSAAAHSYRPPPPPPAPAAPVYTAPQPPPEVHVTVTTPAGATTSQAAAVAKLKELKGLLKQGLITQSQTRPSPRSSSIRSWSDAGRRSPDGEGRLALVRAQLLLSLSSGCTPTAETSAPFVATGYGCASLFESGRQSPRR